MVKLTSNYLFRRVSKKNQLQPKKKDEKDRDYLNRMTHLYLQSQYIDKISPMLECNSVSVIYLQNNLLQTIENLESFPNLTHLYLQHNYLNKIENLRHLKSLRKLYLGYNEISVVENLESMPSLSELHLENQRLPQGETLYFDPRTISKLGKTLKVLNISNNNLTSIRCLSDLVSLNTLIAEYNLLDDIDDVMITLSSMPKLEKFNSEGNPVTNDRKYLDNIIIASKSLKVLNNKDIDEKTRIFVTNMAYNRECRKNISEFSTKVLNSNERILNFDEKYQFLPQISKLSSKMGSKLFPTLKKLSIKSPQFKKSSSFVSTKNESPDFENSLNVSFLSLK